MGFVFNVSQYKWDHSILPALLRYFEIYGDYDVPAKFRIKSGDSEWREKLWGLNLGCRPHQIRPRRSYKTEVEKDKAALTEIKFCFDSSIVDRDWNTLVLPSLVVHLQELGSCDVPYSFVVPDCPPWPKAAAGLRLGNVVDGMRSRNNYAKQAARDADVLKELGFVWDHCWAEWNDRVFPALEKFKLVKGYNKIPQTFVVPCTKPWPAKSHGLRVGCIVNHIRHR
ncbi:hypothetical protein V7S43_014146 [Phytophthora oleae]|uniref:Helicase-associated domain-containing protein n=1 Tax=Phytophthora oleae TaxID=2107226 RepID=A0ABD3F5I6_9STRA